MAYDRFDTRDERSRWSRDEGRGDFRSDRRDWERDRGGRDERGFFERAGDEVASWFGDEDAERRRREDQLRDEREHGHRGPERSTEHSNQAQGHDRADYWRGRSGSRDHWNRPSSGGGWSGGERDQRGDRGYRPLAGDYGRSEGYFTGSSFERGGPREAYTGFAAGPYSSAAPSSRDHDPHYRDWRERHLSELDRDYDDYRRENQARFEQDFGSWRERRMHKRSLLGLIREHMEVIGNDGEHIGTVERIAGDRIILAKSDPESGGAHHSLSCSDIDRVEGDRVILDSPAEQAKSRWRDESRGRALFEREDQGEMGPRGLDRSFEGTYR